MGYNVARLIQEKRKVKLIQEIKMKERVKERKYTNKVTKSSTEK